MTEFSFLSELSLLDFLVIYAFIQQGCINHLTLKTGVLAAENSALPSQE